MNENSMTPDEAAEYIGVHEATLRGWARDGKVPGAWQTPGGWWRFRRSGLDELMQVTPTTKGQQQ